MLCNIQRNKVSKLNHKLKKTYFKEKRPKGNNVKDFWNYCKLYFTKKGICNNDSIILVENDNILNKDSDISETFNNYFANITKDLGTFDWADDSLDRSNIFTGMSSFSNHPIIQTIKDKYQNSFNFKFEFASNDQVIKFIDEIDCNKSSSGDFPAKNIKIVKEEIEEPIRNCINSSISTGTFPNKLKIADIVPVFKKKDPNDKTNYRQCLDKSGVVGTVLMDLSKACDCLHHDNLLAKLSDYDFHESAITLVANYL